MKWDCRGIKEQINKIKESGKSFTSYKALKGLDNTISALMQDTDNDTNSLLTYRRIVRTELRAYK